MRDPARQSILESVQRVREGVDAHRHPAFARHMFRIPERDFYALKMLYPDLASADPMQMTAAWEAFERSPFSEVYRVGKIRRGVIKNGIILP